MSDTVTDLGMHGLTEAVISNTSGIASLKTSYTTLNDTVSKIKTETADISQLTSDVNTLKSTTSSLTTSYNTLKGTVGSVVDSLTPLIGTVSTLSTKAADLQTSYTTLNSTVAGLKTSYTTLNSTVAGLKTSYTTLNSTVDGLKTSYTTLNSTVGTLKTGYNNLYDKVLTVWNTELDSYVLHGYYASISGWSSLTPLNAGASWMTILPALEIKYADGKSAGTGVPEYVNALRKCYTYGLQLISREDGSKIDVIKTSNGFALTGFCVNIRSNYPYVVAYSAFLLYNNNTLSMPTVVRQHNLYSI